MMGKFDDIYEELDEDHKLPEDEDMRMYLRKKKDSGAKSYQRNKEILLKFEEFCKEYDVDMESISSDELTHYTKWLSNKKDYADTTIEQSNIRQVGKFLKLRKGVDEEVIQNIDKSDLDGIGKIEKNLLGKQKYVEKDEFKKMLNHTKNLREELILKLLWETGARRGEAVKILLDDINRKERKIKVFNLKRSENQDKKRDVYYTSLLENCLIDWLDRGGREQYQKAENSPYLLVTNQSKQMQSVTINETVKRVADRAGILEVVTKDAEGKKLHRPTAHSLRHAFAVHRVKNGCPVHILTKLMGHHDISVTEEYLSYRDRDKKEANRKYRPRL
jgi:integrase/recombinase XerD